MENSSKWLVVGGDSLVGSHLGSLSRGISQQIVQTTRREENGNGQFFADLDGGDFSNVVAVGADVAFLCAAMTNMQACRENPDWSYRINVTGTVALASQLVRQGTFVVFLSSNTVFDGLLKQPNECESYAPITEYGRQKVEAEKQLLALSGAAEYVAIVRLSKVLAPHSGMAGRFLQCLRAGESFPAFIDLKMSPISLDYLTEALLAIASRKLAGIFHLSGEGEMSYAEFACRLAAHVGAPRELVRLVTSGSVGVETLFNPEFPALGMERTQRILGIGPEPINRVLNELSSSR